MEYILEVKNLTKKYPDFTLDKLNFNLPKGMILGFIGENGAGKTTTIKAILNIIKDYTGEIKIFGKNNKSNENIKEEIGVVLDDAFFPEILTPKDINNSMASIYKNWDQKLFFQYLKMFSLAENKALNTFSKGMKKKLEIVTALAHHPKLLILDEPTSGLDPVAREEIISIFQDLIVQEETSILLSSHITTDLEHIADYIVFINEGKIVLSKTKDEIIDNYGLVKCSEKDFLTFDKVDYISYKKEKCEYVVLVDNKKSFKKKYKSAIIDKITLDELMYLIIKGEK